MSTLLSLALEQPAVMRLGLTLLHFVAGHSCGSAGCGEATIREYIRNQEEVDKRFEQLEMFNGE